MLHRFSPWPIVILSLVLLLGDATMVWFSRPTASEQPGRSIEETKSQIPPLFREMNHLDDPSPGNRIAEPVVATETIQGRIVLAGEVPPRKSLMIDKDIDILGDQFQNPSLIVDEVSQGIANVVVWIDRLDGWPGSIAAEQQEKAAEEKTIFIRKGLFEPRVAVVQLGDTLTIENTDEIGHYPKIDWIKNPPYGITVAFSDRQDFQPTVAEPYPIQINCTIHSHMSSWLVVSAHRFVAVTDDQGRFTIPDVPVAEHQLVYWHERLGKIDPELMLASEDDPDIMAIDVQHFEY